MPAYVIDADIATYVLEGRQEVVDYLAGLQKSDKNRIYRSEVTRAELPSAPGLTPVRMAELKAVVACADEAIAVDAEEPAGRPRDDVPRDGLAAARRRRRRRPQGRAAGSRRPVRSRATAVSSAGTFPARSAPSQH